MNSPKVDVEKLKKSHWTSKELENVYIVADFVQYLMNDHDERIGDE